MSHDPHRATYGGPLDPSREHDACGTGVVARASGQRSHDVVAMALEAVARVAHRGAASTDNSGDGAGLLTQIPHRLFFRDAYRLGLRLQPGRPFGVGCFFLPADADALAAASALVETVLAEDGIPFLGWRDVPTNPAALGPTARASCPVIRQAFVGLPAGGPDEEGWERELYLARREMERRAEEAGLRGFYVTSLSCRTIVYKALLTGTQLPIFYTDFRYPEYESAIAVFHQRYSTNTLPSWPLAQPFRMLAHNGEINTLWGNRNAMAMRETLLDSPLWGRKVGRIRNAIWEHGSDSASLDNAMELLALSGRDPVHTLMMMIPQAWEKYPDLHPSIKAFYEYHQCVLEPWDGPAAVAFTDGVLAGAIVDRNGLRPCRYKIRRDGLLVAGSEVGLVDLDPHEVIESGKVGPGEVIVVDTRRGEVIRNLDAKLEVAGRRPYARWVARYMARLEPDAERVPPPPAPESLGTLQRAFGYGFEDVRYVLEPMGQGGIDAVWSMGDDTPIPPLSRFPQSVYAYFRQRFAQVTNPPIDSLRESMVMSLRMHLGRRGSPLLERPSYARMLRIEHPVLLPEEMAALHNVAGFSAVTLDALWDASEGPDGLRRALLRLRREAERAARRGARILILSDRGVNERRAPIPMLLAIGAVRSHLVHTGLRARVGLVGEVGDAIDIHHFAALIGYGAEAVHPWLALATLDGTFGRAEEPKARRADAADAPERPRPEEARRRFRIAAEKGLLKVLSKMGISTLSSYCGAQIFEALGLGAEVIELCFAGTASPIGGIGFEEIGDDVLARHRDAFAGAQESLPDYGRVRFRKDGEDHGWTPTTVVALQQAVKDGRTATYAAYVAKSAARRPAGPRDLLAVRTGTPIPLEEVEPVEAIRRRFISSAMSLGALSPEAHATLAIGMNRMGARSNSGEGGEDPANYRPLDGRDRTDNRIKQVASARFGVTAEYLVRAEELEIKIVQGAKPGEGGQLPGHKVTELIARLRHAVPGIQLISPPPHHDIYSIEDLAQLIHDLKTVNPAARVGVKLVAESGVGTVAAGVCKAYADYVLIAGHNGGTGASPLSSIKHAGAPWELGLAETQQALVRNGLRHRIEVRTDGGLRTGRDVIIAALLGAEAYGFGTAALVAIGCAMARQCHLNTCPTGVATQRPDLRAKFKGTPEQVVTYFTLLAEEVRGILAGMGARTLDEIIGRSELLERVEHPEVPRAQMLDLSLLLGGQAGRAGGHPPLRSSGARNDRPGLVSLDAEILEELTPYLESGLPFAGSYQIRNHHLTVGARIAGAIASRFGDGGLPEGRVRLRFTGPAGQSFGAFAAPGMHLDLEGEANDYVGKGLSGGEITIRPFRRAAYAEATHQNLIVGNVCLYGATAGRLFAAGQAGDRFAVRNSGAIAVIEGAGNHCCEYMTGGIVVVLGRAGRNLGAGMSNGVAYVLDEGRTLHERHNPDMVELVDLEPDDEEVLLRLVREHEEKTTSPRARGILVDWARHRALFRKVAPKGASQYIATIRTAYLQSRPPVEREAVMAR